MPVFSNGVEVSSTSVALSDMAPPAESSPVGSAGNSQQVSRGNHQHPRITGTYNGVLDASGLFVVTFVRQYDTKPGWVLSYEELLDGQPLSLKIQSWTYELPNNTGKIIGCVVKGYRAQLLPSSILTLAGLVNLNVAAGGNPSGVLVSLTIIPVSVAS